ncbi:MAG: 1,4-dihydroxy-2-naphthoate polyprenyltransferase [Bacteroidales bacterium]|nr:1,4-dihydroxy-2-naphthoate polyprenyltransferase [Bacteroidales bacterium]
MASAQSWVKAARLRTLPLALSSIAMGGFVAGIESSFRLMPVIFAGITTLLLQILSNFANDYGDSKSGIDNKNRVGPTRTVQSGEITKSEMKIAVLIFSGLSLISGLLLVFFAAQISLTGKIILLLLGLGAIVAAIKYTVGKRPYGYIGLGDLFVFIFFGLVAVIGTYFLATNSFHWTILLPAISMGMFSSGVLNLNNLRDIANDRLSGKRTLVVSLGYSKALFYHAMLILVPFILLSWFAFEKKPELLSFAFLLLFPLFLKDLIDIFKSEGNASLDPYLKKLALKTLLLTIIFGLTINL